MTHLEYRIEVSLCLLKSVQHHNSAKKPRISSLPDDVRFDGSEHQRLNPPNEDVSFAKRTPYTHAIGARSAYITIKVQLVALSITPKKIKIC